MIGLILSSSKHFEKSDTDNTIVTFTAIGSAFLYYWIKARLPLKNMVLKVILSFIITEMISGALIGILTAYL